MSDTQWPAWYYGPQGEAEIYHNADEVPEGWLDNPNKHDDPDVPTGEGTGEGEGEGDGEGTAEGSGDEVTAEKLADANTQAELIELIEEANKAEDTDIEFAGNWSKLKLAEALLDAGVEVTLDEEEE